MSNGLHRCAECDAIHTRRSQYCSRNCADRERNRQPHRRNRPPRGVSVVKPCVWCGHTFTSKASNKTAACSLSCANSYRRAGVSCPIPWSLCRLCAAPFVQHQGRAYCSPACSDLAAGWYRRGALRLVSCFSCGDTMEVPARQGRYQCESCRSASKRRERKTRGNTHRKRALRFGVGYEPINPDDIYRRDNWVCGICLKMIDSTLAYPHAKSASLDHVIPMSLGGDHMRNNVQASHLECNLAKGNAAVVNGEQLRLIG